jgi:hypothetical protein
MKLVVCTITLFLSINLFSQKIEVSKLIFSGTFMGGYVDNGAYLNFTGPGLKLQKGNSDLMIGVLPSLRFKEDKGITKNSFITPSLGLGITYTFKTMAIQIPFYYISKTTIENGKWKIGIGIGLKINNLLSKNKTVK